MQHPMHGRDVGECHCAAAVESWPSLCPALLTASSHPRTTGAAVAPRRVTCPNNGSPLRRRRRDGGGQRPGAADALRGHVIVGAGRGCSPLSRHHRRRGVVRASAGTKHGLPAEHARPRRSPAGSALIWPSIAMAATAHRWQRQLGPPPPPLPPPAGRDICPLMSISYSGPINAPASGCLG